MTNTVFGANWIDTGIGFFAGNPYTPLGSNGNNQTDNTEANAARIVRAGGTMSLLTCNVNANTNSAQTDLVLRNQSGNLNSDCAVTASTPGIFQDSTHSDTQVSGDKIDLQAQFSSVGTFNLGEISVKWSPGSGGQQFFSSFCSSFSGWSSSSSAYQAFSERYTGNVTTESDAATLARAPGTLSNLALVVESNSNANSASCNSRINGSSGSLALTIPASTTGYLEDTTHSDSVVSGDFVNTIQTMGAGTVNYTPGPTAVMLTLSGVTYDLFSNNFGGIFSNSADQYLQILAKSQQTPTESLSQLKYPFSETLSRLRINVTAQGAAGVGINMRINAADGSAALLFSATGWLEDTTHTDSVASGDLACLKFSHVSGNANAQAFAITGGTSSSAATGNAAIGTVDLSAPTAEADVVTFGNADIGTIDLDTPRARAEIDVGDNDARITQAARLTLGDVGNIARASQAVRLTVAAVHPDARATQAARLTVAGIHVDGRVTQAARLVIADAVECLTFWCQCWRIVRKDGRIFTFTSLDEDFEWGAETYISCRSLSASAAQSSTDVGNAGSVEITGIINDSSISEADIYGGRFDDAFIEVWLVAFKGSDVPKRIGAGWAGNLQHGEQGFTMDVVGPGGRLSQQPLVKAITPSCRWKFGSKECGVNSEILQLTGSVTSARGRGVVRAELSAGSESDVQWVNATLMWTSGPNNGQTCEVNSLKFDTGTDDATIVLWALAQAVPNVGDTFDLIPGCDFLRDGGCTVYDNIINFGGFPDVPGNDSIQQTPDA